MKIVTITDRNIGRRINRASPAIKNKNIYRRYKSTIPQPSGNGCPTNN